MRSSRPRIDAGLCALLLFASLSPASAAAFPLTDQDVFGAMKTEMTRSLADIREGSFSAPYFIAYRLVSDLNFEVSSSFGALTEKDERQSSTLYVEVRYGSRRLDNTNLSFEGVSGPAQDDPLILREDLWRMTDAGYKEAIAGYLAKKAEDVTRFDPDRPDDFSTETATAADIPQVPPDFDKAAAESLTEKLSAVFKSYPDVYDSQAWIELDWARRRLLTSEGTEIASPFQSDPDVLELSARTRAQDGMALEQSRTWVAPSFSKFPPLKTLEAAAEELARNLEAERAAPIQPPMTAPAILDPEFTGVLFHEAIGHKLEGERQRDPRQNQIFKDMVGRQVIPSFLSVVDDPTLAEYDGQDTHGFYRYDAEGVPAQRVVLVDHGILRNFLMSRWPVKGFPNSNGHGRANAALRPIGRMSNLIIKAADPVPLDRLKKRLLALIRRSGKPYGFLLVGAFGGDNVNSISAAQTLEIRPKRVYRIDARTGKATLVRGVAMVGTPLDVLNRIVAAGNDETLFNAYFCGAESGEVPVSQIAPSVLVSEIELQRLPENRRRPPILPSPLRSR